MRFGMGRVGRLWPFARQAKAPPDPRHAEVETAMADIRASGLFDPAWYLAQNPDVAATGGDPLRHYVAFGAAEGRRGSPRFDPHWYLGENPDAGAPGTDPLLHFIRVGRPLGRSAEALDAAQAFDSFKAASRAGALPFAGLLRDQVDHVHYPVRPRAEGDDLPLPPSALAERIGSLTLEDFDTVGRELKEMIVRCLPEDFDFSGARVLDFGCGIGRIIRHFAEEARSAEFWGCDIDGTSIRWAVETMTPPFRFYQMNPSPSLPFEDSSFDLIYAVSIFSQVHVDWHQWAVELRRVLRPGGVFFMSYAGQAPFEDMLGRSYADFDPYPGLYVKNPFNSWNRGGPMVFMSPAWVERYWGSLFDIDFVAPDALLEFQSICVMRKPEFGKPPRMSVRVVETATRQAFHPEAVGRIDGRFDAAKPFLDSFGVEVSGSAEVTGWIALRRDEAVELELIVDGVPVPAETTWDLGATHRAWPDTRQSVFRTRFDAEPLPRGRGRLSVRITGRRGTVHEMSIPLLVT